MTRPMLLSHRTYEWLWEQAVPAEQRIEELLKEAPPQTRQMGTLLFSYIDDDYPPIDG